MYRNKAEGRAYQKKWCADNKEHVLEYFRAYRERNREKIKMWQNNFKEREKDRLKKERHESYIENKKWHQEYGANNRQRMKQVIMDALGNMCVCCAETAMPFLTVEHIHQDGGAHRRTGKNIYPDIIKQGIPKDRYTILCMNCNFATRFGKKCPHDKISLGLIAC